MYHRTQNIDANGRRSEHLMACMYSPDYVELRDMVQDAEFKVVDR